MSRILWGVVLVLCIPTIALAQGSSNNYRIDESSFSSGGTLDSSSDNYEIQSLLGDLGVGESASSNYAIAAGFTTTPDPSITVNVTSSEVDLGLLSRSVAKTGTAAFTVKNYLSDGYVVTYNGVSLTNDSYVFPDLDPRNSSQVDTEQFGFNLVANTSPTTFGTNPVQIPDSTFSFGQASGDYSVANEFKFASGDTIATSPTDSGQTNYTMSFMANQKELTAGGEYESSLSIIVTGTY